MSAPPTLAECQGYSASPGLRRAMIDADRSQAWQLLRIRRRAAREPRALRARGEHVEARRALGWLAWIGYPSLLPEDRARDTCAGCGGGFFVADLCYEGAPTCPECFED